MSASEPNTRRQGSADAEALSVEKLRRPKGRRLGGLGFSAVGLVGSVGVHLATFVATWAVPMSAWWFLHLTSMAAAGSAIVSYASARYEFRLSAVDFTKTWEASERLKKDIRVRIPRAVRLAFLATAMYVAFNFVDSSAMLPGSVEEVGGQLTLTKKGRFIRNLSETEAKVIRNRETRLFSGHWMIFSLVGLVGHAFLARKEEADAG